MTSDQNRREFLGAAAGVAAFTIVPRPVLGGPGFRARASKITLAYIGVGTQGLRELLPMLAAPDIQIVWFATRAGMQPNTATGRAVVFLARFDPHWANRNGGPAPTG